MQSGPVAVGTRGFSGQAGESARRIVARSQASASTCFVESEPNTCVSARGYAARTVTCHARRLVRPCGGHRPQGNDSSSVKADERRRCASRQLPGCDRSTALPAYPAATWQGTKKSLRGGGGEGLRATWDSINDRSPGLHDIRDWSPIVSSALAGGESNSEAAHCQSVPRQRSRIHISTRAGPGRTFFPSPPAWQPETPQQSLGEGPCGDAQDVVGGTGGAPKLPLAAACRLETQHGRVGGASTSSASW